MEHTLILHQNIGDMILQNGLIRKFCHDHASDTVYLPMWWKDDESIRWMFSDVTNLSIIQCGGEDGVIAFNRGNRVEGGLFKNRNMMEEHKDIPHDVQVYSHIGYDIDVKYKWSKLNCGPNPLPIPSKPYAFIHEKFGIIQSNTKLERFYSSENTTKNIFNFHDVLLNASEYHVVDSSFMNYIEVMNMDISSKKFFLYNLRKTYKYPTNCWFPFIRRPWVII